MKLLPPSLMLLLALLASPAFGQAESAAPLVNLPDFTRLVERAGPAVVNIEATLGERGERSARAPELEEMPEFFRRFFGQPGIPVPPERGPRGVSQGTGFIISADGYVLTNHHVIDGADEILVRMADRRELKAELVGSDPLSDVALLKVEAKGLPTLAMGDSRNLKPGQWVLAIGSPFGFDHSVTAGIVSGVGRRSLDPSQQYVPFIQTDVAINRGNSGGPLLNTRGEVVGINSQIFSNSGGYMGVSFAIPIEVAMNAVRQLRETGKVVRGQLGVRIQDVDRDMAGELGLDRPVGAFVVSVENDSAAARAGIRPGDVILAFNGQQIARSAQLPPLVGAMAPGSRASLEVLREGKRRDVVVVLEALQATEALTAATGPAQAPAPDLLGLAVEELSAARRAELGLGAGEGVRIARVTGLAARQAGLNPGDVILQVGREQVGSVAEFRRAAEAYKPGDEVRLLVRNARSTGFVSFILR
ncbi:DegQ family serine endoprotease [Arenimonas fontis]|uniref:Probable periplasmic serine endoprotease DegP-like n=1 Tax=Arenimonas fontis TaxID=2608255 RepID=A0A5B2ZA52_9GAMM|nr:DegQ family serine endoprotease [Arenimonas fontis]